VPKQWGQLGATAESTNVLLLCCWQAAISDKDADLQTILLLRWLSVVPLMARHGASVDWLCMMVWRGEGAAGVYIMPARPAHACSYRGTPIECDFENT
jgi:hypothetical protein